MKSRSLSVFRSCSMKPNKVVITDMFMAMGMKIIVIMFMALELAILIRTALVMVTDGEIYGLTFLLLFPKGNSGARS